MGSSSLLTEILEEEHRPPEPKCSIAKVLKTLDPEDADDLREAMAMPTAEVSGKTISKILIKRGFEIKDYTVQRHRNKDCKCWPRPSGVQGG